MPRNSRLPRGASRYRCAPRPVSRSSVCRTVESASQPPISTTSSRCSCSWIRARLTPASAWESAWLSPAHSSTCTAANSRLAAQARGKVVNSAFGCRLPKPRRGRRLRRAWRGQTTPAVSFSSSTTTSMRLPASQRCWTAEATGPTPASTACPDSSRPCPRLLTWPSST